MNELFEYGKKILKEQPFSSWINAELISLKPNKAVLSIPIRDNLKQQHGYVHGGIISYLADNALTFAGGSVLGDSVTSEYKINYVRPALGQELIARASVIHAGVKQVVCDCKVYSVQNASDKLVATAQGTIVGVE